MRKVYISYGQDVRNVNDEMYGMCSDSDLKYNEVWFTQVVPISREECSSFYMDSYRRLMKSSFAQAGHETHNMR